MKYTIISHYDLAVFEIRITEYIDNGWVCQGGVAVIKDYIGDHVQVDMYFQAMVKL